MEEYQYLDLIERILKNGTIIKEDRTKIGTISLFGEQLKFNLTNSFPLLTTKKVYWKGVVEELLWFISGSTDAKVLASKGVNIWNGHSSREYLDSLGFTDRPEGDIGAGYSFQWRHWGAKYIDCNTDYTNQGIDQLDNIIKTIRTNPSSRRIVLSSWNVADLKDMNLPPCHLLVQFRVADGKLDCMMTQRSADIGLGMPFNIASYSLLTYMIAHLTKLTPGVFTYSIGDSHIYTNHVSALREQVMRVPIKPPKLTIRDNNQQSIDDFVAEDFILTDYNCHPPLHMKMAV